MRHASHRWFAQVLWLAVGPLVVSGGFAVDGWGDWSMFLLGLLATSLATHGVRWASKVETTRPPGSRIYGTAKDILPRWRVKFRVILVLMGAAVTAMGSIVGAARALVHRTASQVLHGHRALMQSIIAPVVSGAYAAAATALVSILLLLGFETGLPSRMPWVIGMAVAMGWASAIFCDLLTDRGVCLLYPFSERRISLLGLKASPPKWQRGADGEIVSRPNPVALGEATFNGIMTLAAIYFAVSILAVA